MMKDGLTPIELPVPGFPISAAEVARWFRNCYGRDPGAAELIQIINAMAERDATPPVEGGIGELEGVFAGKMNPPPS